MDNSPTALFDSYESDFKEILRSIRKALEGDADSEDIHGEQRNLKAALRRVGMELDEAEEMVSQMEIEIQGIPQSLRPSYQTRIKACKADLARYKKLSKDVHAQLSRSELLARPGIGTKTSDEPYGTTGDRTRLLAGTALLEDGNRRLLDSQRTALETEEQGADILRSIRGQREQIQNARDTVQRGDTSIDRASSTLKKMIRRYVPSLPQRPHCPVHPHRQMGLALTLTFEPLDPPHPAHFVGCSSSVSPPPPPSSSSSSSYSSSSTSSSSADRLSDFDSVESSSSFPCAYRTGSSEACLAQREGRYPPSHNVESSAADVRPTEELAWLLAVTKGPKNFPANVRARLSSFRYARCASSGAPPSSKLKGGERTGPSEMPLGG
ncbi:vesicle transport v-SNARE protein N-terminus-domain-containing protein [Ganoderma leucocontextum]|nr:vesicle transport v-SNARE protein N-terminus-domain-containing protein [Ganoderma leucocontextum]